MSSQGGPLEIRCDAPPYPVVHACQGIGMQSPLDVRWWRLDHFLAERQGMPGPFSWKLFFSRGDPQERACTCGEPLPTLEKYAFTLSSGRVLDYLLGQCPRCRTVFWEEG